MTLDVAIAHRIGPFHLDVAFQAPSRGVTALFGRSGSGKTSLVNTIAGLIRPERGHVRLDGRVFLDRAAGIELPVERRRIGYVFQDARLFPHMTVQANLAYGYRRVAEAERRIAMAAMIDLLDLGPFLDRRPRTLSGGERQRVALGRALLAQPRRLLMDEPLASLDGPRKAELLPYIERLSSELALPIVYVSHALDEVVRLADNMLLLEAGRVRAFGPVAEIVGQLGQGPLEAESEPGAVLQGHVLSHEPDFDLTHVALAGMRAPEGQMHIAALPHAPRTAIRLHVLARDVIVATARPTGLSVQNILPGNVREILPQAGPFALVAIDIGGQRLLARLTRQSVVRLGLTPGASVYALVKTAALARDGLGD
ncbi:MAG: molybdenum ABC transporter ATP-binding protein [Alphaproteobacteria bacterium]|nr:molybdenum ABC transporter ATP-binding protein [Alphaproteobacteria bacterium]